MHKRFERYFPLFNSIIFIVLTVISGSMVMMYPSTLIVFLTMGLLFFLWLVIARKADRIIKRQNMEIDEHNTEFDRVRREIWAGVDQVIEDENYNFRLQGSKSGMILESFNRLISLLESKQREIKNLNEALDRLVDIDPLTDTRNRRSFHQHMENIHLMALRYNHSYGIIICDIDNFRLFNDTYGHQKGDEVLISIVNTMKATVRITDGIFRWGGEEFVIILPHQDLMSALKVAENLRAAVELLKIEHRNHKHRTVTISCGVCCNPAGHIPWADALRNAEDALYKAKQSGRNCVCAAPDTDYKT